MAAKKKTETTETPVETVVIEEDKSTEVVETPVVVPQADIPTDSATMVDVIEELKFAQSQIDLCATYLAVGDIGPNGMYRAGIKVWQGYRYNLRRYEAHGGNVPARPEVLKDY